MTVQRRFRLPRLQPSRLHQLIIDAQVQDLRQDPFPLRGALASKLVRPSLQQERRVHERLVIHPQDLPDSLLRGAARQLRRIARRTRSSAEGVLALPQSDHVIASSIADFPPPLEPDRQATRSPLKSSGSPLSP